MDNIDSFYHQSKREQPLFGSEKVKTKFADSLFKEIFKRDWAVKDLLEYLGENVKEDSDIQVDLNTAYLMGDKENDLSFWYQNIFYYFIEHQSTLCKNMPIRILFYITQALDRYIRTVGNIYETSQIQLPEIRAYTIFTGMDEKLYSELEKDAKGMLKIESQMRLSDAYLSKQKSENIGKKKEFDLELVVHTYDMRMTVSEILAFFYRNEVPQRFLGAENALVQYALFVNSVKGLCKEKGVKVDSKEGQTIFFHVCKFFNSNCFLHNIFKEEEVIHLAYREFSKESAWLEAGREAGREEGERRLALLMTNLIKDKRFEELQKIADDVDLREQLYKEYHIAIVL